MTGQLRNRHHWIFCLAALGLWVALGWPNLRALATDTPLRGAAVPALWLVPFAAFGATLLAATLLKPRGGLRWALLGLQLAAVLAMATVRPSGPASMFLVIIIWQVAMATTARMALGWVALQTLALVMALGIAHAGYGNNPSILGLSVVLQLLFVLAAHLLRVEAENARALARANRELRSAQAIIAGNVRDAERLRISRELHDAWGHELAALGLQLEIASHVTGPGRAGDHVLQAKGLARDLLGKVRDVVATLREAERCDLEEALEALARSVPSPAVHLAIAPDLRLAPDQAHALLRCAQEALTNAIRHSRAPNLWLELAADGGGVRLVARNDGDARRADFVPGSGLVGMRERLEALGGRLTARPEDGSGFTVEAWLPSHVSQAA